MPSGTRAGASRFAWNRYELEDVFVEVRFLERLEEDAEQVARHDLHLVLRLGRLARLLRRLGERRVLRLRVADGLLQRVGEAAQFGVERARPQRRVDPAAHLHLLVAHLRVGPSDAAERAREEGLRHAVLDALVVRLVVRVLLDELLEALLQVDLADELGSAERARV